MGISQNKAIIQGRLGADPDLRYFPSGGAVCNIRVATNETYKKKGATEPTTHTEWHSVVLHDKQAENVKEYLRKGDEIYVEARIRTRKWTDKDGVERYTTELVAIPGTVQFGAKRPEPGDPAGNQTPPAGGLPPTPPDFDDDIPL